MMEATLLSANALNIVADFLFGLCIGILVWMIVSTASAEVVPVHSTWPDVPLVGTSCEKIIHDLPRTDPDGIEYNSVVGLVTFTFEFNDGTVITLTYNIADIIHEEPAAYDIRVEAHPLWYTFSYKTIYEMWFDRMGQGDCRDYYLRSS